MLGTIAAPSLQTTVAGVAALSAAGAHHAHHAAQRQAEQDAAFEAQMAIAKAQQSSQQQQQEPIDSLQGFAYQDKLTGTFGTIDHIGSKALGMDFMLALGAGAVTKAGGFLSNRSETPIIGKPAGFLGKWVGKAGDLLGKPRHALEHTTVGNALERTVSGTQGLVGKVSKSAAEGMNPWVAKAQETQAWMGQKAQAAADATAQRVGSFVEESPALQARMGELAKGREAALAKAHSKMMGTHLTGNENALVTWWSKKGSGQLPEAMEAVGKLNQHLGYESGVAGDAARQFIGSMNALHDHVSDVNNLHNDARTNELIKQAETHMDALRDVVKEHPNLQARAAFGNAAAGLATLKSGLEPLQGRVGTVAMIKDPVNVVKSLPKSLAEMNLHQAGFNAVIGIGSAATVTKSVKNYSHDLKSLEALVAASEGKMPGEVSAVHALMGHSDSPSVKAARAYMMKVYSVQTICNVADVALNISFMKKGGVSSMMTAMPLMMGTAMVPSLLHGENMLTAFGELSRAAQTGQPLGANAYAEFIHKAMKQAHDINGNNGLMQALGEHYAAMKATPSQMLHEIESNHITQVAGELQQKMAQEGRAPGQAAGEAPTQNTSIMQHPAAAPAMHAAAVAGTAAMLHKAPTARATVGQHTARINGAASSMMHHLPHQSAAAMTSPVSASAMHAAANEAPTPYIQAHMAQHVGMAAANDASVQLQA